MSQAGVFGTGGSGGMGILTITGDGGGAIGPDGGGNVNLLGGFGIDVTGDPGTNTLTIDVQDIFADTYDTDSGSAMAAAGVLNIFGGENINTSGSGNTVTINLNRTIFWPDTNSTGTEGVIYLDSERFLHSGGSSMQESVFLGQGAGNFTNTGLGNIGVGHNALGLSLSSGEHNIAVGSAALIRINSGSRNIGIGPGTLETCQTESDMIAIGYSALTNLTIGNLSNIAIGTGAMAANTIANGNIAIGYRSMYTSNDSDFNIAIGYESLISSGNNGNYNIVLGNNYNPGNDPANRGASSYNGSESSNIIINNNGVNGESNTIRIGTTGSGDTNQNRCFIAGIHGVNPTSNPGRPVIISPDDQLGSLAAMSNGQLMIGSTGADPVIANLTAGTGISITNGAGSITISSSGSDVLTYTAVNSSPYVVLSTDQFLGVDCSGGPITIQLPNAPSAGRVFYIKDSTGNANTNNITVTTVGGAVTIDGSTSYAMNTQYAAINVLFDGSTYQIF